MSEYYIILNGSQAGPFSKDQLLAQGLTGETLVWTRGFPDWVAASTVEDLSDLLNPRPYNPYGDSSVPPVSGILPGLSNPIILTGRSQILSITLSATLPEHHRTLPITRCRPETIPTGSLWPSSLLLPVHYSLVSE